MITARMAELQDGLRQNGWMQDRVRLVSISVDPETDTPEVLRGYANAHGADPNRWLFLTGTRPAIWNLANEGFMLGVGADPSNQAMPIFHSSKLSLVDGKGRLRGHYDGLSDEGQANLVRDLQMVLMEP
jgi:protein SCO1/2